MWPSWKPCRSAWPLPPSQIPWSCSNLAFIFLTSADLPGVASINWQRKILATDSVNWLSLRLWTMPRQEEAKYLWLHEKLLNYQRNARGEKACCKGAWRLSSLLRKELCWCYMRQDLLLEETTDPRQSGEGGRNQANFRVRTWSLNGKVLKELSIGPHFCMLSVGEPILQDAFLFNCRSRRGNWFMGILWLCKWRLSLFAVETLVPLGFCMQQMYCQSWFFCTNIDPTSLVMNCNSYSITLDHLIGWG